MEITAHEENKLTLENILGLDEERAETVLSETILVTFDKNHNTSNSFAIFLKDILSRTFQTVTTEYVVTPTLEIVIGEVDKISSSNSIFVEFCDDSISISESKNLTKNCDEMLHESFLIIAACYTAAFTMRRLIGHTDKLPMKQSITLDFHKLYPDKRFLYEEIDLERTYLAGAGAVGNGFLYTLRTLKPKGSLVICDEDMVSSGNLNRCLFFDSSLIGRNKATVLAESLAPSFDSLELEAHEGKLESHPDKNTGPKWLSKLVVAVDSRRARRKLQMELPKEVFDASTTGIDEVFLYLEDFPLKGNACLECIYYNDDIETAHEKHIAESLGVNLDDIKEGTVSKDAALRIVQKYKMYKQTEIVGLSYDTLFKELCGKGEIYLDKEQEQILAPFAFVSILAGAFLAIESARRISNGKLNYNTWRISPWLEPIKELRLNTLTNPKCNFCSDKLKKDFANTLWSE